MGFLQGWTGVVLLVVWFQSIHSKDVFTNSFVVQIRDGSDPHSIAKRNGYDYKGQVLDAAENLHHFVRRDLDSHRSRRSVEHHQLLESDQDIINVNQLTGFVRHKRGFKNLKELFKDEVWRANPNRDNKNNNPESASWSNFNDPLLSKQWYLKNTGQADGQPGLDLNVEAAWAKGYTGKGVTIAIMDDGIDYLHPDLAENYNEQASYDFSSDDALPYPRYTDDWFNSHGTRCAGEVSAVADNGICGVGIAYNSKVAGIRMLDQPFMTDLIEASSMRHKPQLIDIYSASWGPQDNGRTVDGPRDLTLNAIAEGVNKGRGGKGSIYVWASGDGGPTDDCNCDGYASSMWTISINSAINDGRTALYDESCSSTLASTFSNGRNRHPEAGVATTDLYGNCTLAHSGTSAAAPEAAAVFALALEANPNLTWRDIQHLIVLTSKQNKLYDENYKWQCNGIGLEFNHLFGFGVLDAGAMVTLAEKWQSVPERFHCTGASFDDVREIPSGLTGESTVIKLNTDACKGQEGYVRYLEHAQAIVSLNSTKRGDVTIFLTSPMGTRSILLSERIEDYDSEDGFRHWPFMTTHTWGEDPTGEWTLEIAMTPGSDKTATLTEWTLILHGTQEAPYIEDLKPASSCVKNKEEVYEAKNITTLDENGLPIVVPNEDFDKSESSEETKEEEEDDEDYPRIPEDMFGENFDESYYPSEESYYDYTMDSLRTLGKLFGK